MNSKFFLLLFIFFLSFIPIIKGCNSKKISRINHATSDSVWVAPGKKYQKNFIHHFLFGKHYRDLWATEVKLPVFHADSVFGGLSPLKVGGSQQTVSIHLEDNQGRRFVLRSVDKDPSAALPVYLRATFINAVLSDQMSASNPYAGMIVDDLSKAVGIYHTHPTYYYIPENSGLGEYGKFFEGKIGMLEEKPNASWKGSEAFGSPVNIYDTEEMMEILLNTQNTHVDQKFFLYNRLFDLWINDWDRHADQWEWLKFNEGDKIIFKPLPRDRDGAFFIFDDGLIPFLASRWWGNRKFQSFHSFFEDVSGLLINSVYVDNLFLNRLSYEEWCAVTDEFINMLSDSAIIHSVRKWPQPVYEKEGKRTIRKLMTRRDQLQEASLQFFKLINENVCIPGTDGAERILAQRKENNTILLITSLQTDDTIFFRAFDHSITDVLNIYALSGNDEIIIEGTADKGLKINIYGGPGEDRIVDRSKVSGIFKKTCIYDSVEGNIIDFGSEAADRTTSDPDILTFNRTGERRGMGPGVF